MPLPPVTHCRHNHEYTPENTQIGKDGKRRCRQCARARNRAQPVTEARKAYLRDYRRAWVAKRRREYMADKSCVRCGSTDRLEVDHIDPKLKVDHRIWSWTKERRERELAKCQILCALHHKEKTKLQRADRSHGSSWRYRYGGCSCSVCRMGEFDRRLARRKRKAAALKQFGE